MRVESLLDAREEEEEEKEEEEDDDDDDSRIVRRREITLCLNVKIWLLRD